MIGVLLFLLLICGAVYLLYIHQLNATSKAKVQPIESHGTLPVPIDRSKSVGDGFKEREVYTKG